MVNQLHNLLLNYGSVQNIVIFRTNWMRQSETGLYVDYVMRQFLKRLLAEKNLTLAAAIEIAQGMEAATK